MNDLQAAVEMLKKKIGPGYWKSIDVDEGWYQLVIDCDKELTQIDPNYQIAQIKQKFGGLRYYFQSSSSNAYNAMEEVVRKYETIAAVTCESTGEAGVLMRSKSGWYRTLNMEYASNTAHLVGYSVVLKTQPSASSQLL